MVSEAAGKNDPYKVNTVTAEISALVKLVVPSHQLDDAPVHALES